MTISILSGAVRLATATDWTDARSLLRRDIEASYKPNGGIGVMNPLATDHYRYELSQLDKGPDKEGWLVTSGQWGSADTMRYAREGTHGLTSGDLAIVHEHSNGNRDGWTVDVKCKIIRVDHETRKVTVRITGDSSQFTRNDVVTIPCSFVITRGDAKQRAKRY